MHIITIERDDNVTDCINLDKIEKIKVTKGSVYFVSMIRTYWYSTIKHTNLSPKFTKTCKYISRKEYCSIIDKLSVL